MLNFPEFCGKLLLNYSEWRRERQYQKYALLLLTRKIRLWDVPKRLRRDPEYAPGIYIIGFRADRMVSRERYERDLCSFEQEVMLIGMEHAPNPVLVERLQTVLGDMKRNLKLFDIYEIANFH